ncbi:MAG TPA: NAD-dependent epimerase/dehydratase family protein [Nocardioidaceae bacterium]|nr:NAD-dependent epimerase/dehydratase family protein [Nocardioidaceae bacterium]
MRVVVIGATGNVGGLLVDRLVADPAVDEVVGASRRRPDDFPAAAQWRPLDLRTDDPAPLLAGADAVVHLGWLFQPTHRPGTTWAANVEGTARVLRAVSETGVQSLVYASSVGAYSPRTSLRRVDEDWPTHGFATAAYSREKAYVERMLDTFESTHPDRRIVRLRPGFIFRREAAVGQRRLFGGPLVPAKLLRKVRVPVLPDPGGLVFQTVHTDDVVQAYQRAVTGDARGAFNIAADPVIDMPTIGHLIGVPVVRVPQRPVRAALAAAWSAHLMPPAPGLFDLLARVPLMDTARARDELGWQPEHDSIDALRALLAGLEENTGAATPPLDPQTSGPLRSHEFGTGIGEQP